MIEFSCIAHILEASELRINEANGVHACSGRILTLGCIVNGRPSNSTVWRGTAFSGCDVNEITMLHLWFEIYKKGITGTCSNGYVTGWSVRIDHEAGNLYISQLETAVDVEMGGKSVVCAHDNGTSSYIIGTYVINAGSYNYYNNILLLYGT